MISYPWLEEVAQKLDQLLSLKVLTLEGPKGLGKKEIAHEIAKHKLCSSNNACGDCNPCKIFVAGTIQIFLFSIILIANLLKLIKLEN